jgi:predicted transcriptional regulator
MKNISNIKLTFDSPIKEALQIIDKGAVKFAIVVDNKDKLLGTITDGDIRRAILNGKTLECSISNIYNKKPTVVNINNTKEEVINICTFKKIYQIPIVDDDNKIVGVKLLDELLKPRERKNKVMLMVGGLGTKLRPLTNNTPKPMLLVGGKPILQTIVEKFVSYGFVNIIMCVGYKSNIIQDFFGDGSNFGAKIEYILEDKRMGTAGALTLLNNKQVISEPFFVMN